MSKQQQDDRDWIDELEEDPVLPDKTSDKEHTKSDGWKFYLRVKDQLPDWWEEFNGTDVSKKHGIKRKYRDVKHLAKAKLKDRTSRQYLIWMIGPKSVWKEEARAENSSKYMVPWLGDWYQRRRNGAWLDGNKPVIKQLRKAIKEQLDSNKSIKAAAPFIVQMLLRKVKLQEKIDEMFAGEPFYSDERPDSKNNKQRFHYYLSLCNEVDKSITKCIHEWMRLNGVNPKNPHEMADMATMVGAFGQVGASAALTGMMTGMQMIPNQDGTPSGSHMLPMGDGHGIVVTPDALLLAKHLSDHGKTFNKPFQTIEQDAVIVEEEKPNGKANGKHKAN